MQRDNQTTEKLQDWASGTGDRLKTASISTLSLGSVAFVMVICLILHEDDWVARIVAKFPKKIMRPRKTHSKLMLKIEDIRTKRRKKKRKRKTKKTKRTRRVMRTKET